MYSLIFIFTALILNILLYCLFIAVLTHSIHVITTRPYRTPPKHRFYLLVSPLNFFRRYGLYYLNYAVRSKGWYALNQKMHVIIIRPYLQKNNLISFFYALANFFQCLLYPFRKYFLSILGRANQMIQQQTFIMAPYNMIAHTVKLTILTPTQESGNSFD